jgi:hypothetical protein
MLEIPVRESKAQQFRQELSKLGGRVKNVIAFPNDLLLFIVDPQDGDEKLIGEAGFKTILSEKGLEIFNKTRALEERAEHQPTAQG